VCIQVPGADEAFGWSALLDHHDTMFQFRARERATALCLTGEDLLAVCHQDPVLGGEILGHALRLIAWRLRATEVRLAEFYRMQTCRKAEGNSSGGQFSCVSRAGASQTPVSGKTERSINATRRAPCQPRLLRHVQINPKVVSAS